MATTKKRKKVKRTKKKASSAVAKKRRTKKGSLSKKDGFPTLREMLDARNDFAEEVGIKILTMSKVKELPKVMGLRASADFGEALAKMVYTEVFKAAKRCVTNDRKTIRPSDL